MSLFGDPSVRLRVPEAVDVDGSGRVDGGDLILTSRYLGTEAGGPCDPSRRPDVDGDGSITSADLLSILELFGDVFL